MSNQNPVNDGGPAFPHGPLGGSFTGEDGYTSHQFPASGGMSLRTWLAGRVLSSFSHCTNFNDSHMQKMAKYSAKMADIMIAELEKGGADGSPV